MIPDLQTQINTLDSKVSLMDTEINDYITQVQNDLDLKIEQINISIIELFERLPQQNDGYMVIGLELQNLKVEVDNIRSQMIPKDWQSIVENTFLEIKMLIEEQQREIQSLRESLGNL